MGNVCECGALQGDHYLGEPGAAFFPLDDAGVEAIELEWVEAPIEAVAGLSMSSWMDSLIARHPFPGWRPPPPPQPRRTPQRT